MIKNILILGLVLSSLIFARNHVTCKFIRVGPDKKNEYHCSNGQTMRILPPHVDVWETKKARWLMGGPVALRGNALGGIVVSGEGNEVFHFCPENYNYDEPKCGTDNSKIAEQLNQEYEIMLTSEELKQADPEYFVPEKVTHGSSRYSNIPNCYSKSEYLAKRKKMLNQCKKQLVSEAIEREEIRLKANNIQNLEASVNEKMENNGIRGIYSIACNIYTDDRQKIKQNICNANDSLFMSAAVSKLSELFSDKNCFNSSSIFRFAGDNRWRYSSREWLDHSQKCYNKIEGQFDSLMSAVDEFLQRKKNDMHLEEVRLTEEELAEAEQKLKVFWDLLLAIPKNDHMNRFHTEQEYFKTKREIEKIKKKLEALAPEKYAVLKAEEEAAQKAKEEAAQKNEAEPLEKKFSTAANNTIPTKNVYASYHDGIPRDSTERYYQSLIDRYNHSGRKWRNISVGMYSGGVAAIILGGIILWQGDGDSGEDSYEDSESSDGISDKMFGILCLSAGGVTMVLGTTFFIVGGSKLKKADKYQELLDEYTERKSVSLKLTPVIDPVNNRYGGALALSF